MAAVRIRAALTALAQHDVEFLVVGGVAAFLNGVPVQTVDVDVLYALFDANVDRLMTFLDGANAIFRMQPDRQLKPTRSHVGAGGHLNLLTRFGPMDFLGTVGENLHYEDMLPNSEPLDIGAGRPVRVLNLETIIRLKEELGTDKDKAMLPLLRETLRLSKDR